MLYRALADLVVVVHLGFIAFVVVGGFLAWRWPRVLWLHLPVVAWALTIVVFSVECPLTPLENHLRHLAGQRGYSGGFIDHYLTGVLYPGRFIVLARALVAAAVLLAYAGLLVRHRRAHRPDDRPTVRPAEGKLGGWPTNRLN